MILELKVTIPVQENKFDLYVQTDNNPLHIQISGRKEQVIRLKGEYFNCNTFIEIDGGSEIEWQHSEIVVSNSERKIVEKSKESLEMEIDFKKGVWNTINFQDGTAIKSLEACDLSDLVRIHLGCLTSNLDPIFGG